MLAPAVVEEIRRLLAEDRLSQRKIARLLGVSRGVVLDIANDRRPERPPKPAVRDEPEPDPGPAQRCPGCGAMVYLPCRLCRVRRLMAQGKTPPLRPSGDERLPGMDLMEKHQERYERVRRRRERSIDPGWLAAERGVAGG